MGTRRGRLLLLGDGALGDESRVNARDDAGLGNDAVAAQLLQFVVASDGEIYMSRSDASELEILACVPGELEDFRGEVFEDGGEIHGGFRSDAGLATDALLQLRVDPADWEL
jgi:hypothetical protein